MAAGVNVLPLQTAAPQVVPAGYLAQVPFELQTPFVPQDAAPSSTQVPHDPPQPSSPQVFPAQLGVQTGAGLQTPPWQVMPIPQAVPSHTVTWTHWLVPAS